MITAPTLTSEDFLAMAVRALRGCPDLHDMVAVFNTLHDRKLSIAEVSWTGLGMAIETVRSERVAPTILDFADLEAA